MTLPGPEAIARHVITVPEETFEAALGWPTAAAEDHARGQVAVKHDLTAREAQLLPVAWRSARDGRRILTVGPMCTMRIPKVLPSPVTPVAGPGS